MKDLRFGTAGIPLSTRAAKGKESRTILGVERVHELNLGAMELEFVRNVNVSADVAPQVKEAAKRNGVVLTCHGQYFVNLNATNKSTLEASRKRILDACRRAWECGVWSICYHAAFYMKMPREQYYPNIRDQLASISKQLRDEGIELWLRPEYGGKVSQFGDLSELISVSQDVEGVAPCVDWAHVFARSQGKISRAEQFCEMLAEIERTLGREALNNMHCHAEGIAYGDTGERHHVNFSECKLDPNELVKAWKEYRINGVITCESPNIEQDALLMQKLWNKK
ncbi:TIM barrel protein [archaeon]|nr:TIM barrel protein [archaeon]